MTFCMLVCQMCEKGTFSQIQSHILTLYFVLPCHAYPGVFNQPCLVVACDRGFLNVNVNVCVSL